MGSAPAPAMDVNMDADMNSLAPGAAAAVSPQVYSTNGEITEIIEGETMTLSHEAVAALGWPAMVMGFQIPSELDVSGFRVGDSVTFEFSATPQGRYRLSDVRYRDLLR
ncbi:MAG: copper-binding protein, partial [Proteobacteria bacterium]|nr:copper-binding protein [Pseudomonadota bacterium]